MKTKPTANILLAALFTAACLTAAAEEAEPTLGPENPAPNILSISGRKRFFVSQRFFIRNWAALGVWVYDRTRYDTEMCGGRLDLPLVENEAELAPRLGEKVDGREWLPYNIALTPDRPVLDMIAHFKGMPIHSLCFAAADVYCPEAVDNATLMLGRGDSVKAYLNGKLVYTAHERLGPFSADTDEVKGVSLVKGWNRLLLKCACTQRSAEVSARFLDAQGNPMEVDAPRIAIAREYRAEPLPLRPMETAPATDEKPAATIDLAGEWRIRADRHIEVCLSIGGVIACCRKAANQKKKGASDGNALRHRSARRQRVLRDRR